MKYLFALSFLLASCGGDSPNSTTNADGEQVFDVCSKVFYMTAYDGSKQINFDSVVPIAKKGFSYNKATYIATVLKERTFNWTRTEGASKTTIITTDIIKYDKDATKGLYEFYFGKENMVKDDTDPRFVFHVIDCK